MTKTPPSTESNQKGKAMRRLVGQALVAGADYAGNRMMKAKTTPAKPKKSHKVRKIVGLAMVVGAAYAANRMMKAKKANSGK